MRAASHRLVDQLLGALTGRPGGFASQMTYAEKVGRWRRVFAIDSDGFDLRAVGPDSATAVSPAFGPGAQIYYALSEDYSPVPRRRGPNATPVPIDVPGSIMGLAFSADHTRMALDGHGQRREPALDRRPRDHFSRCRRRRSRITRSSARSDKVAYVAGTPVQRIYIGGKAISPPGFMASAPVFCDTPQGLLVIFTVGVGVGRGHHRDRHERRRGPAADAARRREHVRGVQPRRPARGVLLDRQAQGRRGAGRHDDSGAGLFIMPIQRPWLAKKISSEVGESLRWEASRPSPVRSSPRRAKYGATRRRGGAPAAWGARSRRRRRRCGPPRRGAAISSPSRFRDSRARSALSFGTSGSKEPAPAAVSDAAGTPSDTRYSTTATARAVGQLPRRLEALAT